MQWVNFGQINLTRMHVHQMIDPDSGWVASLKQDSKVKQLVHQFKLEWGVDPGFTSQVSKLTATLQSAFELSTKKKPLT